MSRNENQLANQFRMPEDCLKGNAAAEAVSQDIGAGNIKMAEQRSNVLGHQFETEGTIAIICPSMSLQMDSDDLMGFDETRHEWIENLAGADAPMEKDQRPAITVDLVIQVKPINESGFSNDFFQF